MQQPPPRRNVPDPSKSRMKPTSPLATDGLGSGSVVNLASTVVFMNSPLSHSQTVTEKMHQTVLMNREKRRQMFELAQDGNSNALVELLVPTVKVSPSICRSLELDFPIDEFNNTFLHMAVAQCDTTLVATLLRKGANPNVYNNSGASPYRLAQLLQHRTIAVMLKRHGSRTDALSHTLLWDVTRTDASKGQQGKSPRGPDRSSVPMAKLGNLFPPIGYAREHLSNAAYINHPDLKDFMDPMFVDTSDLYGVTPLMKAAYQNRVAVLSRLLKAGAKVSAADQYGYTALTWACLAGAEHSVKRLVAELDGGRDAIQVEVNLRRGSKTQWAVTCLMAAAISGSVSLIKMLLDFGAKIEPATSWQAVESSGQSVPKCAFSLAVWLGHFEAASVLLDAGAPIPKDVEGWLWQGVCWAEGLENRIDRRMPADKTLGAMPLALPLHKLPNKESIGTLAIRFYDFIKSRALQNRIPIGSMNPKLDDKAMDALQNAWGNHISLSHIKYPSENLTQELDNLYASLKQKWGLDHSEMLESVLKFFQPRGTALDQLLMNLSYQIAQLISAASRNSTADYVIIASRAINIGNNLVYTIEKVMESGDLTSIYARPNVALLFNGSLLQTKIKETARNIKTNHLKTLMADTRVAVGTWPPPNAIESMIETGYSLAKECKILIDFANASGAWTIGELAIDDIIKATFALLVMFVTL